MNKKRILIITQEMKPYLILSEIAKIANSLPVKLQEQGMEIRVLMPKFGSINERRHRLHEVVRLSGINIIIDNDDFPLIIKVASLPGARLQVYFLDNEDFFRRKNVFADDDNKFYEDNAERMIFFCKGAIETIKKFGWPPDVIHCHGWMTSLIPLYIKTVYKKEPVFSHSKVLYSVYENTFKENLAKSFLKKALINKDIKDTDFEYFKKANNTGLLMGAISHADAVIIGSEKIDPSIKKYLKNGIKKPVLDYVDEEKQIAVYLDFYQSLLKK